MNLVKVNDLTIYEAINTEVETCNIVNKFKTFLFCIYILLSFYEGYLNQMLGSITKYYIVVLIFIFLLSYKTLYIKTYHLIILLWLSFKLASIFWSSGNGFITMYSHFLSQVGMVIFFIIMTTVHFDELFIKQVLVTSQLASFSMALLGVFFSENYRLYFDARQVLTLFGIQIDPNNLSALYLVGLAIALNNIFIEKKAIIFNVIIGGTNLYSMLLTASRAGLVSICAIALCIIFLTNNKKNKLHCMIKNIIIILIASIVLFFVLEFLLPQPVFERMFDFSSYEGGSGREYLWSSAIDLISERPFFGWGWGGHTLGAHNTYLTMMCDIGIIGTMQFVIILNMVFFQGIRSGKILSVLLLVSALAPSFFIEAINKRFLWNGIIIALMIINSREITVPKTM